MKVFISYGSVDRSAAFELMRVFKENGCDVWLDFFDIKPAEVLDRELGDNLNRADLVCILLSPTSVASRWVGLEIKLALERRAQGLRVLPVILRPCAIPDRLGDLVGVDMSAGFDDEASCLRVLRAVLGTLAADDAVLLSAGQRAELAKKALRDDADRALPTVAQQLARIRNLPIREVSLSVALDTFPSEEQVIMELRLTLDPLWTQPMSFFFARYREGATWPEGFDFHERPYTDYYKGRLARLDCKFRWFDRVEEPSQTLDGTDLKNLPPSFQLKMDGSTFQPSGRGVHLPQTLEIPSLQALCDKSSRFELIAHTPLTRTAALIDLSATDIDIEVSAHFAGQEPSSIRLFHSRHDARERTVLGCNHLAQRSSDIEREALLGLYLPPLDPAAITAKGNEQQRLRDALDSDAPVDERDRRSLANLAFADALLAGVRGDPLRMLQRLEKTARLLEPVVLEGYPTYEEGMLMYRACENLVGYFIKGKNYPRAASFANGVGVVAQRLIELDPGEPDHQRAFAEALRINAIVHAENGDTATAAVEIAESVEIWRTLCAARENRERLQDARLACTGAREFAQRWGTEAQLPLAKWAAELSAHGAIDE